MKLSTKEGRKGRNNGWIEGRREGRKKGRNETKGKEEREVTEVTAGRKGGRR